MTESGTESTVHAHTASPRPTREVQAGELQEQTRLVLKGTFGTGKSCSVRILMLLGDHLRLDVTVPKELTGRARGFERSVIDPACGSAEFLLQSAQSFEEAVIARDKLESFLFGVTRIRIERSWHEFESIRALRLTLEAFDDHLRRERTRNDIEAALGSRLALHAVSSWLCDFPLDDNQTYREARPSESLRGIPDAAEITRYLSRGELHAFVEGTAALDLEFRLELIDSIEFLLECQHSVSLAARKFLQAQQTAPVASEIWLAPSLESATKLSLGVISEMGCEVILFIHQKVVELEVHATSPLKSVEFLGGHSLAPAVATDVVCVWHVFVGEIESSRTGALVLRDATGQTICIRLALSFLTC